MTILMILGCAGDEFTCNNGECIDERRRCNSRVDCSDRSDEDGCGEYRV